MRVQSTILEKIWDEMDRIRYDTGERFGLGFLYLSFKADSQRYLRAAAAASDHLSWIQDIYTEVGRSR